VESHANIAFVTEVVNVTDILLGKSVLQPADIWLHARYGNRHGMIAGATGTGKSVSLMVMAEGFSRLGVPVFIADVKGDLAGLSQPATISDELKPRLEKLGLTNFVPAAKPVVFWDIYGKLGHPVRATVSEMGPVLFARLLELNDVQSGVLEIVFKLADDNGWLLLDLKDLRALLNHAADKENAKTISADYGLISPTSVAVAGRPRIGVRGADQAHGQDSCPDTLRAAAYGTGAAGGQWWPASTGVGLGQGDQRRRLRHQPPSGHARSAGEVGRPQRRRPARQKYTARRARLDHAQVNPQVPDARMQRPGPPTLRPDG
jgi:hypothetical protein